MMTGSLGVSFLFPQLFLSQHRLNEYFEKLLNNPKQTTIETISKEEIHSSIYTGKRINTVFALENPTRGENLLSPV